jgi:hypothetical protein
VAVAATRALASRSPVAADALLHPVALVSLAVLVVNDHLLKAAYPGFVTGKLSDVAALALFPIFLVAARELMVASVGRRWRPSRRAAAVAVVATAVVFTLVELVPAADALYEASLGALQWPARALLALLAGDAVPVHAPAIVTADPTDVLTVPAVLLAWWVLSRRATAPR